MIIKPNIKLYSLYYFHMSRKMIHPPILVGRHLTKSDLRKKKVHLDKQFIIKEEI